MMLCVFFVGEKSLSNEFWGDWKLKYAFEREENEG